MNHRVATFYNNNQFVLLDYDDGVTGIRLGHPSEVDKRAIGHRLIAQAVPTLNSN